MEQTDQAPDLAPNWSWYRAVTLNERITASRDQRTGKIACVVPHTSYAQQHLQQWRTQKPFQEDDTFAEWLALHRLDDEEVLSEILMEEGMSINVQIGYLPNWIKRLTDAYMHLEDPLPRGDIQELLGDPHQLSQLLTIAAPLLRQSRERLKQSVQDSIRVWEALPFDPTTIYQILVKPFLPRLLQMIQRTLILELHVMRVQGSLVGNTPQERFAGFVAQLQQPNTIHNLLNEYPVLARLITESIERWEIVSLEFLQRLCADWNCLCSTFAIEPTCRLTELQIAGDFHHDGHTVNIITFDSDVRIVYKPRSLAIYQHMQDLVHWLNTQYASNYDDTLLDGHLLFRTCTIINKETYGWMEYIAMEPCTAREEIQRFYYRQGAYLALLYSIAATDIHYENIIAAGEYPVPIDLETLFQPHFDKLRVSTAPAEQSATQDIFDSVIGVGMLPRLMWTNDNSVGVDASGLGGKQGQLSPRPVLRWQAMGTDSICAVYQNVEIPPAHNRPTLNGKEVRPLDYLNTIMQGFTDLYNLLVSQKDTLLDTRGPLLTFAQDQIRVVIRPTLLYMMLLQGSYHPDVLRDALDRDRFFDKLWEDSLHQPSLLEVIAAEQQSLWQGDIPLFTTRPDSLHLWDADGHCICDFFDETGLNKVCQRLQQLDSDDLYRQQWYIQAAMTVQAFDGLPTDHMPTALSPFSWHTQNLANLVEMAEVVGERLVHLAWCRDGTVSWIGIEEVHGKATRVQCLGPELYNGTAGVALFFAWLGHITQRMHYTRLAEDTITTILQYQLPNRQELGSLSIGGFAGLGGIIYTLTHLGVLWKNTVLLNEATTLLTNLPPLIEADQNFDLVAGSAGCIVSLLGLYYHTHSLEALRLAKLCGDRLIAHASLMDTGLGWYTRVPSSRPLTGFSHGTSGIAWALFELAAVTGADRFRETAIAALQYEHSVFSHTTKNWPDFRTVGSGEQHNKEEPQNVMCFWCHGASGIALGRLHMLKHYDTEHVRQDIDAALQTTLTQGFGTNHCVCHGDLGNLEVLLQASLILGADHWRDQVSHITASVLEQAQKHGWRCGTPMGIETPGLMMGLAGIGYQLLRLADPEGVPSILTLELPTPSTH